MIGTVDTPTLGFGIYRYTKKMFGKWKHHEVPVKIIAQTDKSYKIVLLGFAGNKVPNAILWVKHRSVQITKANTSLNGYPQFGS